MKATKYLSLAALALMGTLASCQSNDEAATNSFARPDNAVGINVTVGSLKGTTRSNPAATDDDKLREFNLGDQISVSTEGQDPVIFQCTDANMQTWAEAVSGKFLLWTQNEMIFQAYYPATEGTSMTAFTLPADQSTEAKIALADYMTRQQTFDNENGTDINLNLERKTARVIVRIYSFTDQYDEGQQTVSNVRINSQFSTINDGNGQGDVTAVTPYQDGNGGLNTTYTALVVPGYDDEGADFITLTDGENNTLTVKGIHELREGFSYTYNLTVGKNTIQVASVTVTDWTTGETLAGGQATEASVPVGALSGKFTVASGKQVYFSKGNLQATYDGSSWTWAFAENQWDYIGNAAGNTSINGNGTVSASNVTVDLFGWVGASNTTWTGAAQYGISNSNTTNSTSTYGNNASEALKSDWGNTIGSGWRTLTKDEWTYLFNTRTVNGGQGSGKSYTLGQSVNGKLGVVIYPDDYTGSVYAGSDWSTFEAAGCVFLPAAGYRSQASVSDAGSYGYYWSSSSTSSVDYAYYVYFYSGSLSPASSYYRDSGLSVRLVRQVE